MRLVIIICYPTILLLTTIIIMQKFVSVDVGMFVSFKQKQLKGFIIIVWNTNSNYEIQEFHVEVFISRTNGQRIGTLT